MSKDKKVIKKQVVDSIVENILGIEFKKTFFDDNSVNHFVNGEEVVAFSTSLVGKNSKELIVSIVAKVDE